MTQWPIQEDGANGEKVCLIEYNIFIVFMSVGKSLEGSRWKVTNGHLSSASRSTWTNKLCLHYHCLNQTCPWYHCIALTVSIDGDNNDEVVQCYWAQLTINSHQTHLNGILIWILGTIETRAWGRDCRTVKCHYKRLSSNSVRIQYFYLDSVIEKGIYEWYKTNFCILRKCFNFAIFYGPY